MFLFAMLMLGGATALVAQMDTGEDRSFAYRGYLAEDGVPSTTPHDLQFALFTSPAASTACLAADPASSCGVWSEAHAAVDISAGVFSVMLGRGVGDSLTDAVMNNSALYLGVAVRETAAGDATFTVLPGLTELAAVPWAARAAAAKNYTITGQLSAGSVTTSGALSAGSVTTTGTVSASSASVSGDILKTGSNGQLGVSVDKVFRDTGDTWLRLNTAAGSSSYADFAAGTLHAATALTVIGDAHVGGKLQRTEYQSSCAGGLSGSSYPYCCRINVRTGATACSVAGNSSVSVWTARANVPFGAGTNGPYSLTCAHWVAGVNFPFCCRTGVNGAAECAYNTNDHINGAWTATAAPY